ncbi:MAG: carboxypeptidase-like regulatory domain-containing protein [Acidobacteriota bacterium]
MFRKDYLKVFFTLLVLLVGGTAAFAQNAPVRGTVKLQKGDGTVLPVVGAIVEAYRTDIDRGKMPEAKTNKRGEFSFIGFPLGQRFVLSVSGAGIGPRIQSEIKGGMENIEFIVNEGDGRRLTEAEAREAAKGSAAAPASGEMSEAEKKERAELEKKNAQITASNKKAEDSNKVVNEALKAGAAAFKAQNYDLAITEFEKGVVADPDYVGSAPVLLNYKGTAYQKRALASYNAAAVGDAGAKAAAQEKIKSDLSSALEAFKRALEVIEKGVSTANANEQSIATTTRMQVLANILDTYGYGARIAPDPASLTLAGAAMDQYVAAETDVAKRNPSLLTFANNMSGAGELTTASVAFRKVLETSPDNIDALIGLGLALYSEGWTTTPPDKVILQEGLNYMQRFVDTAPDTHKLKESTKAIIEELKNEQKLAPQKTAPKRKG